MHTIVDFKTEKHKQAFDMADKTIQADTNHSRYREQSKLVGGTLVRLELSVDIRPSRVS
jgi:hypothetical protein